MATANHVAVTGSEGESQDCTGKHACICLHSTKVHMYKHKLTAVEVVDLQGLSMYKDESRGCIVRKTRKARKMGRQEKREGNREV